jgi:hypothetical protein
VTHAPALSPRLARRRGLALSQKWGSMEWPGRVGFPHGSSLLPPTSLPAADHPACDLAAAAGNMVELAYWNTVKDSGNPRLFQVYLDK